MLAIEKFGQSAGGKMLTIRDDEQIEFLPEPDRSSGDLRLYAQTVLDRRTFIRHAHDLLRLSERPEQPCAAVDTIAKAQLARLRTLEAELKRMLAHGPAEPYRAAQ